MAKMWPKDVPLWVRQDRRRAAEIKVFEKLRSSLSDDWSVYYSRPWWGITSRGGEKDGEADFIVAHPQAGVLFLEVKGGSITYDPTEAQWRSTDRDGIPHRIKDPVEQARGCKHAYIRKLKDVDRWPRGFMRFRHGVVFPDTEDPSAEALSLGGHPREIFCHAVEFDSSFAEWVSQRLDPHVDASRESGPGESGISVLHQLVAAPVQLQVAPSRLIESALESLDVLLTGAQLNALSLLSDSHRIVVEGGAGTGKTLIACEFAVREAAAGQTVLVLCASTPLALFLKRRLHAWPAVEVSTLGAFLSRQAGPSRTVATSGSLWNTVIVDEGQDVASDSWKWITAACAGDGKLAVFMDSNQAIYRLPAHTATQLGADVIPLRANLRNTQRIARVSDDLYHGPQIRAYGPVGEKPTAEQADLESASHSIATTARRLVAEAGVSPTMITVLVPTEEWAQVMSKILHELGLETRRGAEPTPRSVTVETVSQFKGLESPLVLLLANREVASTPELAYVAATRAQVELHVFGQFRGTALEQAVRHGAE